MFRTAFSWVYRGGRSLLAAALLAGPALAQDLPFSPAETEACLAGSEGIARQACIGRSAAACIETPGGYTTVGTGICLGRELDYWDGRLNAAYGALRKIERAQDAEMRELGSSAPPMAVALRDMQRAWIAFRDASCAYERSQWGGGTGGGPASVSCAMQMTARQAMELERRLEAKSSQ